MIDTYKQQVTHAVTSLLRTILSMCEEKEKMEVYEFLIASIRKEQEEAVGFVPDKEESWSSWRKLNHNPYEGETE